MLAFAAALLGAAFAQWSAPWVAHSISTPDYPARFSMPADWRVFGFGVALSVFVMLLFGLAPALRASSVKPASALKGDRLGVKPPRQDHPAVEGHQFARVARKIGQRAYRIAFRVQVSAIAYLEAGNRGRADVGPRLQQLFNSFG